MNAKQLLQAVTEAMSTTEDTIQCLAAVKGALEAAVQSDLSSPKAKSGGPNFMSLPLEIRNMIYHFLLVEPHKGYVKCDIEYNYGRVLICRADLQIFRTNHQINTEASSIFYSKNVFAIAQRQYYRKDFPLWGPKSIKQIDACRVTKWHIITRGRRWKSNASRTSPQVYRKAAKQYASMLGEALKKPHQVQ